MAPDTSAVRMTLSDGQQSYIMQPGRIGEGGWHFGFHNHLATDSQPFDVAGLRQVGWANCRGPGCWIGRSCWS